MHNAILVNAASIAAKQYSSSRLTLVPMTMTLVACDSAMFGMNKVQLDSSIASMLL